jgi:hypothetical protein
MAAPFLAHLGISDIDQARSPTADAFPHAFNINCKPQWDQAVGRVEPSDDPKVDWGLAIRNYVELCTSTDRYPFSNMKQSSNDQIVEHLKNARRAVVKFLNNSKFLNHVQIRTTARKVKMNNMGFSLDVFGQVYIKDPTFVRWLLEMPYPGFRIKHEGRYIKHIGNDVTMVVYNEGANGTQRWHIGYEINCRLFPDLPGRNLPSKAELEKFILEVLFMPVLRSSRPYGYHRRLL